MKKFRWMIALSIIALSANTALAQKEFCPRVYHKGVIDLDINPAFLHVDQYNTEDGGKVDGLTVSSFYNTTFSYHPYEGWKPNIPYAYDQVGRIMYLDDLEPDLFDFETNFEQLTDPFVYPPNMPKTTWPNQAVRVPDGVLPFEGVVIPQGFHPVPTAGRLTIVNVETLEEYIVHEATMDKPRFYHEVIFYDLNKDGFEDIITARSGFKILPQPFGPPTFMPPFSELVAFLNPGGFPVASEPWEEKVLYGGPLVQFMGPDIHLALHNFDNVGEPEIVATHFFSGDDPTLQYPTKGKIVIYGAPANKTWMDVNIIPPFPPSTPFPVFPRVKVINETQGFPFAVEIVDLNGDGQVEVLATNHQFNCMPFPGIPGQVYAVLPPQSGDIFGEDWSVRVLLDNILPQPGPEGDSGNRMAPGHAISFFPKQKYEDKGKRPWILVSGDEAGKVWMMKPKGPDFDYDTAVIFDINDYYGEGTTQAYTPEGTTISTIGRPALRYVADGKKKCHKKKGKKDKLVTEIYIPVFEAQEIHVISFDKEKGEKRITCPAGATYECTASGM